MKGANTMKQTIKIKSGKPIDADTLRKIRDIFKESDCPNESMRASLPDFTSYDGAAIIQLALGDTYTEYIEAGN